MHNANKETESEMGNEARRPPSILESLALVRAQVDAVRDHFDEAEGAGATGCNRKVHLDEAQRLLREALKLIGEPAASNSGPPAGTVR